MKLDINCDLGEWESATRTRALMRWITSANIACGGHAGSIDSMDRCVRLAKEFGVKVGAHPGPWDRENGGRGIVDITPRYLELLLLQQVSALEKVAQSHRIRLHHIKLHGGLYHATEDSDQLAKLYVQTVAQWWPHVRIYGFAGGRVARVGRKLGVCVSEEIFADRGYRDDGQLVARTEPDALISDPRLAADRLRQFISGDGIKTHSSRSLHLTAHTVCVHGDTPNAPAIARAIFETVRGRKHS